MTMNKTLRNVFVLILVLSLMIGVAGCSGAQAAVTVNGEKIPQKTIDSRKQSYIANYEQQSGKKLDPKTDTAIMKQIDDAVVNEVIQETVVAQDAKKSGIQVTKAEVVKRIADFKKMVGGEERYKQLLAQMKLTGADVETIFSNQLLAEKLQKKVTANIKVSDADVRAYYAAHQADYNELRSLKISHILVKTEPEALDMIKRVKAGEDFATLAKKYSIDPSAQQNGGDLGMVNEKTSFVPEFLAAAMALKAGQMTEKPVKSQYGYHVIKAFEEKPGKTVTFEQVKADVQKAALNDKLQKAWTAYQQNLVKKAKIDRNKK